MDLLAELGDERRQIADLFDGLSADQQAAESLCRGWATKDVAGHLVSVFDFSLGVLMLGVLRRRGNINRFLFDKGKETAAGHTMEELAGALRSNAEHPFHPPGVGLEAPLTDVIMHSFDVGRPLGMTRQVPEERLRVALEFMASMARAGFGGRKKIAGLHVEATDIDWGRGTGPAVRGPAASLLMAMGGRSAFCDDLEDEGVSLLRSRLPAS
jgi:uncharacterized protein (TIGR03083 family)